MAPVQNVISLDLLIPMHIYSPFPWYLQILETWKATSNLNVWLLTISWQSKEGNKQVPCLRKMWDDSSNKSEEFSAFITDRMQVL